MRTGWLAFLAAGVIFSLIVIYLSPSHILKRARAHGVWIPPQAWERGNQKGATHVFP